MFLWDERSSTCKIIKGALAIARSKCPITKAYNIGAQLCAVAEYDKS